MNIQPMPSGAMRMEVLSSAASAGAAAPLMSAAEERANLTIVENAVPSLDGVDADMTGDLTPDRIDALVRQAFDMPAPPMPTIPR